MSAAGIVAFIITLTRDCLAHKHKEKDKDKDKYTGKYKDKDRIALLNWGFIITLTTLPGRRCVCICAQETRSAIKEILKSAKEIKRYQNRNPEKNLPSGVFTEREIMVGLILSTDNGK